MNSVLSWLKRRSLMIVSLAILLMVISILITRSSQPKPVSCSVNYCGINLCFQTTVGRAVKQYKLSYTAPGYYYTVLPDSTKCVLQYKSFVGDFENEHQPQTVLYNRIVDAYVFNMTDTAGRLKKEMHYLETLIGSKMTVSKQTIRLAEIMPKEAVAKMPTQGNFILAEGFSKDSVHVFLREVPRLSERQSKKLEVIFSKNRTGKDLRNLTHAI